MANIDPMLQAACKTYPRRRSGGWVAPFTVFFPKKIFYFFSFHFGWRISYSFPFCNILYQMLNMFADWIVNICINNVSIQFWSRVLLVWHVLLFCCMGWGRWVGLNHFLFLPQCLMLWSFICQMSMQPMQWNQITQQTTATIILNMTELTYVPWTY